MKATIIIPTYWRGPAGDIPSCVAGADYLFDHATPLDRDGTLGQALASLSILDYEEGFDVVVIAVPTRRELNQAVQLKVESIVARFEMDFPIMLIGPDTLAAWRRRIAGSPCERYRRFLQFGGYSSIRNISLLAAALTGAEAAVFFDDDQVYRDPDYLKKALRHLGGYRDGDLVAGVTGFLKEDGGAGEPAPPSRDGWRELWGDQAALRMTLSAAGEAGGLVKTSYACGGNMIIHRSLFSRVPFDPEVPRGEDIDYVLNAAFFGYDFFLDGELAMEHRAQELCTPEWHRLRQDIIGLAAGRSKIRTKHDDGGPMGNGLSDTGSYPARFMADGIHDLVMRASMEMAAWYMRQGREEDARESISNIAISRAGSKARRGSFSRYLAFKESWQGFIRDAQTMDIWQGGGKVD
jgi:hypothetical protein